MLLALNWSDARIEPVHEAWHIVQDQKMSKTQLKAKIRAYKYRQKVLAPRRDALADVIKRIEGHIDGNVSSRDYVVRCPNTSTPRS